MTTPVAVRRAELAFADLQANGGVLDPEHQNTFFRNIIDQPTLLGEVRAVQMNAPEMRIPKIGFGHRVLRRAPNTGQGGFQDDGTNTRYLPAADRVKPNFGQVTLQTTEFMAETHIHDDILEDVIEREALTDTILALLSDQISFDLEELIILGDTSLSDTYLNAQDGVLKLATSNITDAAGVPINPAVFNAMKKDLPTRFRRNLNTMRFYTSMNVESDYRLALSSRGTELGDSLLTGNGNLPVLGIPLKGIALMPETHGLLINPKNIIWGIQRNVRIEVARDIRARSWIVVVTLRVALAIEEEVAVVKLTNLG